MVVCSQLPALADQKKVCCVIEYNFQGVPVGNNACVVIGDGFSTADCTRNFDFGLLGGGSVSVPYGTVADCCRDCFPPEKKLVISGGRLVRNGAAFTMSPEDEPEKCCCSDECTCKEVPDCTHVRCYGTNKPTNTDKCKGRCVIKTYDEDGYEVIDDRQVICATLTQCCAEDNTTCEQTCKDGNFVVPNPAVEYEPAANSWAAMPCTTCGVCCVNNYDEDPTSPKFRQVLSKTGTIDKTEAECNASHPFLLDPANPFGPVGVWYPNTDNVNICNPNCCQQKILGDEKAAVCAPTSATECDPCLGRCIELEFENNPAKCPREECKTKQDCCGADGEKCTPQCAGTEAQYRWETGCGDGSKCGTCCKAIYNNEGAVIELTCDEDTTTLAECEKLVGIGDDPSGNPLPDSAYGSWFPFGTCAECDPTPCCREITCEPGKTDTICVNVAKDDCDLCNGTCTELATNNKTCAHYRDCCGDDGENCESVCDSVATHSWSANGCTNPDLCGACCRIEYSSDTDTVPDVTCVEDIDNSSDCKLTAEDEAKQLDGYIISYSWKPFETCATAKCGTKKCCGEKCPGDVGCIDIDISDECDPCKGRCYDNATETATCKTKQDCCGDDGALCRGCPGNGADIVATDPAFTWGGCFENGTKCGICCVITTNAAGDPVSSTCEEESYEECIARGANASWKAFETCSSAICIPKPCCNDEICPGQTICLAVDKDRGDCGDPCRGECYAIDETGEKDGDPFCATKVDCCGEQNEKCTPQPGFCPGSNTVPTHSWPNDCADPAICGVCCKRNVGAGGAITYTCDDTKDNQTDCTAANYGVWYAFGTCAACGETKQACVEAKCKKIVTVDGVDQEVTVTNATCKPVAPDKTNCKGICTELATAERPYAVTTCKTKSECCGSNGGKCNNICGSVPTHSWSSACNDPTTCGVCCIITDIGNGNPTATCQENIGSAACALLNTANGGLGVSSNWIPFGICQDCSIEKCCGTCPDGSISCIDQPPGTPCAQPCNGKCSAFNPDGSLAGAPYCATKAECCIGPNGVNLCATPIAPPGAVCPATRTWEVTCPENAIKCGVCCELSLNGVGDIIGATCHDDLSYADCMALPNAAWKPFDTCETAICVPKQCCKDDVCAGEVGCVTVDKFKDECNQCEGFCTDVDENFMPIPGTTTCSKESDCCEWDGRKCTNHSLVCPGIPKTKVWTSCQTNALPECALGCPPLPQDLTPEDQYTVSLQSSCEQSWFNGVSIELNKTGETGGYPGGLKAYTYSGGYTGHQNYFCPVTSYANDVWWLLWRFSSSPMAITLWSTMSIQPVFNNGVHSSPFWTVNVNFYAFAFSASVSYQTWGAGISCSGGYCGDDPTIFRVAYGSMGTYAHPGLELLFSGCATAPAKSFPEHGMNYGLNNCNCCSSPGGDCVGFECEVDNGTYSYTVPCEPYGNPRQFGCFEYDDDDNLTITPCPSNGICRTVEYRVCRIKRCPNNYPVKVSIGGGLFPAANPLP